MKKILDLLSAEVAKAFAAAGYDEKYARVSISNRPDLCEYQCNGAMAAAKEYHKAPIMIANGVVEQMCIRDRICGPSRIKSAFPTCSLALISLAAQI